MCIENNKKKSRYIINEGKNYILVSDSESNGEWKQKEFHQVYQSQMTARVLESIIDTGKCNLPTYDSSMKLHLKYILPLLDFFEANGMEGNICPIT